MPVGAENAARHPAALWLAAQWEDPTLKPAERCVAAVFAAYAGVGTETWALWDEIRHRTGIRSRDTVHRTIRSLIAKGWMEQVAPARQHECPRYRLTIPSRRATP